MVIETSDYRMIGGIVLFIVVVMAVLTTASSELGDPAIVATSPDNWPPQFPEFQVWGGLGGTAPGCDIAVFCLNVISYWLGFIGGVLIGGVVFIAGMAWEVVSMFISLISFRVPGLPPGLEWVNTALSVGMIFILALLVFRLVRSVIPFVSGE